MKILITGPGRSGTTFLVNILTRLGFDTGFEPYKEHYSDELRAGCEWHFELKGTADECRERLEKYPRIIKSPDFSFFLKVMLASGILEAEHVFIPVRDLYTAAKSRLEAGLHWRTTGTIADQEGVMAKALGKAVEACVIYDVPFTLMKFPNLVQDEKYCYDKLSEGLDIDRKLFREKFKELANPKQIKTEERTIKDVVFKEIEVLTLDRKTIKKITNDTKDSSKRKN